MRGGLDAAAIGVTKRMLPIKLSIAIGRHIQSNCRPLMRLAPGAVDFGRPAESYL
jgi:hypothetical protein